MFGNHMIKMNNVNEQKPLSRRQKKTRHKKFVRGMISMLASIFTIGVIYNTHAETAPMPKLYSSNDAISSDLSITKNNVELDLNKNVTLTNNDTLAVKFNYKVLNSDKGLRDGDILSMLIPDTFKDIKPDYPVQLFKSCTVNPVEGTHLLKVALIAGGKDIETAVAGYLNISCRVGDSSDQVASEVKVEFKGIQLEIPVTVGTTSNVAMIFQKSSQTQKPVTLPTGATFNPSTLYPDNNGSVIGQKINYTLEVNKNSGRFKTVTVKDIVPDGLRFNIADAKIFEIDIAGNPKDMTLSFDLIKLTTAEGLVLGDIVSRYQITYTCTVTKDLDQYSNKAILCYYQNSGEQTMTTESVVSGIKDEYANGMDITKTVSQDKINYGKSLQFNPSNSNNNTFRQRITVNGNKETKAKTILEDVMPSELTLVKDSIKVTKINHNVKQDVTASLLPNITYSAQGFILNLGDIDSIYLIEYDVTLKSATSTNHDVTNNIKLSWGLDKTANDSSSIKLVFPSKETTDCYKKVNGNNSSTIQPNSSGTFIGQTLNYSILVNGFLENKLGVVVTDALPNTLTMDINNLKISKDVGGYYADVTASYRDRCSFVNNTLTITLGDVTDKFKIEFTCKVTAELTADIINTATIHYNSTVDIKVSCDTVLGKTTPGNKDLTKVILDNWNAKYGTVSDTYQGKPIYTGTIIKYQIYLNDKLENITDGTLIDDIPAGMQLVPNSIYMAEILYGKEVNVTNKYKPNMTLEPNKISVKIGDTSSKFIFRYDLQITSLKDNYVNNCTFNNQTSTITVIPSKEKPKEQYPLVVKYIGTNRWDSNKQQELVLNEDLTDGGVLGKSVSYIAVVNEDKVYRTDLVFEDVIPEGLNYVENSLQIDSDPNTNQYKVSYDKATKKLRIEFGSTTGKFTVRYSCVISERLTEIYNKANATCSELTQETTAKLTLSLTNIGTHNIAKFSKTEDSPNYTNNSTIKLDKQDINILNKSIAYKVIINPNGKDLSNLIFKDSLPVGLKVDIATIQVYRSDLTSGNWICENIAATQGVSNEFSINFGNINSVYRIEYKASITDNNLADLQNKASITYSSGTDDSVGVCTIDRTDITLNKDQAGLTKEVYGDKTTVNAVGDILHYKLVVNPECNVLKSVKMNDYIPKGMLLQMDNYKVVKQDSNGAELNVTDSIAKYTVANGVFTFNLGDITDSYIIYYECKVTELLNNYINKAELITSTTTEHREVNYPVVFSTGAGGLNAQKYVDKTFIGDNTKDQIVTYTIKLWGNAILPKNYLNIKDKIDSRVKIIDVSTPDDFQSKIDSSTNEIFITNTGELLDLSAITNNVIEIRIRTDFSNVPLGTVIPNNAKINDYTTSTVKTTKSYAFIGCKKDKDTGTGLEGVKFNLLDKDQKVLGTVTTGKDGKIESALDATGIYYLKEIAALDGYTLSEDKIKIELTEDDVKAGKTIVDLGNIYNKKTAVENPPPKVETPPVTEKIEPKREEKKEPIPETKIIVPPEKKEFIGLYTVTKSPEVIVNQKYELPKTGDRKTASFNVVYYERLCLNKLKMLFADVLTTIGLI